MIRKNAIASALLASLLASTATAIPISEVPAPEPGSSRPSQSKLDEGLAALRSGDLAAAQKAFEGALAINPRAVGGFLGLAEVAGRRGNDSEVEGWLRKGLVAVPGDIDLLHTLGVWYLKKNRRADAEKTLSEAARLAPRSAPVLASLGDAQLADPKSTKKAEETFRKALAADPACVGCQVGLARALAGLGDKAGAKSVLDGAAKAAPNDPRPLHALARLAASQGDIDGAIKYHQATMAAAPDFLAAYLEQGDLYLAKGDIERAIGSYRAGVASAKDPVPALFRLGVAYEAAGRFDDAERAYLDTVKRDPLVFGAYNNLAFMAAQRKVKLDEALAWARKANELAPGVATVRDTLGWVYRARGELPSAAKSIEEAVQLAPSDPTIRYHLGVVYAELGRKGDAEKSLKRALELSPDFRQADDARRRLSELGAK